MSGITYASLRMTRLLLLVAVLAAFAVAAGSATTDSANAHRSGCHRWHTCPSDHATYRWRGLLCVKPTSDKRNSTFTRRVKYAGLNYYCKR
jgi:hypothetical protein